MIDFNISRNRDLETTKRKIKEICYKISFFFKGNSLTCSVTKDRIENHLLKTSSGKRNLVWIKNLSVCSLTMQTLLLFMMWGSHALLKAGNIIFKKFVKRKKAKKDEVEFQKYLMYKVYRGSWSKR